MCDTFAAAAAAAAAAADLLHTMGPYNFLLFVCFKGRISPLPVFIFAVFSIVMNLLWEPLETRNLIHFTGSLK